MSTPFVFLQCQAAQLLEARRRGHLKIIVSTDLNVMVIDDLPGSPFSRVFHHPPSYSLAGELCSAGSCRALGLVAQRVQ